MFKEIKLFPTQYYLDFWKLDTKEQICEEFSKRYGNCIEYYKQWVQENMESIVICNPNSLAGEGKRIAIVVSEMDNVVIIHEIVHAIFDLSKLCHVEINYKSQEWVAYMTEYIFEEICKLKTE